jgi:hypothetical protein
MGYGFDKFGCLSFRLTTIENDKLKHRYIFVHRKAVKVVKVENDHECQIMGTLVLQRSETHSEQEDYEGDAVEHDGRYLVAHCAGEEEGTMITLIPSSARPENYAAGTRRV